MKALCEFISGYDVLAFIGPRPDKHGDQCNLVQLVLIFKEKNQTKRTVSLRWHLLILIRI